MNKYKLSAAFVILSAFATLTLGAQESVTDPASFLGMNMPEMLQRFGPPASVYSVRGPEEWQDDVVFIYNDYEFYILKDRVWQVGVKTAYRIRLADPDSAVFLSLGEAVLSGREFAVFPLKGTNWPAALRCNFDSSGKVTAIFIYRSDL